MRLLSIASLAVAGLTAFCGADAKLMKVALIHRHGARSGSAVINGQVICDYPSCQLTDRGIDQLKEVGRVIKANYAGPLGLPSAYNVSYITSVSTQVPRVVVSAESVITGMYEGQEPLPFIQFSLDSTDVMMSQWNSVPSYLLSNRYDVALAYVNPIVEKRLSPSNVSYMANYLGLYDTCVTQKNSYTCVAIIYDNYNCNYTANIPVDPAFTEMLPRLKGLVAEFVNYMLGYQPTTNEWSRQVGSLGHPWATDIVSFFNTSLSATDSTVMKHYAAHDWSISALYGAVGTVTVENKGDADTVPMFAQTLVFELHADDTTGALSVVPKYGYPSNTPTGPIELSLSPMKIICKSENGNEYDGTAGCPLGDLARYVASTAPQSTLGQCYYTDAMMEGAQCTDAGMPPMNSACLFFRQNCPNVACALQPGSLADPRTGYACSSVQKSDDPSYFAATVVALVAPSILAGAIVGFFSTGAFRRFLYKRGDTSGEREPINS